MKQRNSININEFVKNESFYSIFIIPISYFLTFFYERGKLSYYQIPLEYTPTDISLIFNNGIMVSIILLFLIIIFGTGSFIKEKDPISTWLNKCFIILLVCRVIIIDSTSNTVALWSGIFLMLYSIMDLFIPLIPLIFFRKKIRFHRYWSLVVKQFESEKLLNKPPNNQPSYKKLIKYRPLVYFIMIKYLYFMRRYQRFIRVILIQRYPFYMRKGIKITIIIFLIGSFISNMGYRDSQDKNYYRFIQLKDEKEKNLFVILGSYKDSFIVAPVNLINKRITPSFQLVDIDTKKQLKIYTKHVGKLKVRKNQLPKKYLK
ncbi:hypothetical protein [Marininema halotolerans]|uniref:Uncharacterized protein n=1 Tax=Marininema halotolerans TaxID=1155944 RepID=A0A1I6URV9_9BACL|nr:hypothetical protein [Marininema halotolerans]SFT04198.1 hypothetical protein SAMN05444972_11947 [Marininema halotolerans]